ncbi:MAG: N-acetyltransferase [Desulfobulbaceae bacterium]|uniref:N-acetyltransferase n=1 Tax=Candidatus Desulfatifera sulfidica TaxID=2841691 RepID=A0A8J6N8Q8_9BACT|nr:N-acetyltransferase [Candidatus Desulfatifera sulfidica]
MIRNACMSDVKNIHALLNNFAGKGLLLGRSISSLYDHLRDFIVFCDEDGKVVGTCALHISWENLAEIRSLAVAEDVQGRSIGAKLVTTCLAEARDLGISQVFTLTYQAGFFRKLNFVDVDKRDLPHKIWSDCLNCHKFPDCDEDALLFKIEGIEHDG